MTNLQKVTDLNMKRWGIALMAVGAVFRLTSGSILDWYSGYVSSDDSELQYSAASNLASVIDAVLIPLGVGLLVGGLIVAAIRESGR